MVTVYGHNGYLGSVVTRRWAEIGLADGPHTINCTFPDDLALVDLLARDGHLIQPSTDAIAEDTDYARNKRYIENVPDAVVIRAGIVDIRHQPSVAYRNWTCNPLTPLEWADFAADVRDQPAVHPIGRETLSRYEVTRLVAEVFDLPAPVPAYADEPLDRVQEQGDFPPLRDALIEFRDWLAQGAERERLATGHG